MSLGRTFNSNIRCIEMGTDNAGNGNGGRLNSNIRCIEIIWSAQDNYQLRR